MVVWVCAAVVAASGCEFAALCEDEACVVEEICASGDEACVMEVLCTPGDASCWAQIAARRAVERYGGVDTAVESRDWSAAFIMPTLDGSCGDGVVQDGEECDGNYVVGGYVLKYCTEVCTFNWCGDGHWVDGAEECDDGNYENGDGCDQSCRNEPT
jgi:cysteine-rich repeat protein